MGPGPWRPRRRDGRALRPPVPDAGDPRHAIVSSRLAGGSTGARCTGSTASAASATATRARPRCHGVQRGPTRSSGRASSTSRPARPARKGEHRRLAQRRERGQPQPPPGMEHIGIFSLSKDRGLVCKPNSVCYWKIKPGKHAQFGQQVAEVGRTRGSPPRGREGDEVRPSRQSGARITSPEGRRATRASASSSGCRADCSLPMCVRARGIKQPVKGTPSPRTWTGSRVDADGDLGQDGQAVDGGRAAAGRDGLPHLGVRRPRRAPSSSSSSPSPPSARASAARAASRPADYDGGGRDSTTDEKGAEDTQRVASARVGDRAFALPLAGRWRLRLSPGLPPGARRRFSRTAPVRHYNRTSSARRG